MIYRVGQRVRKVRKSEHGTSMDVIRVGAEGTVVAVSVHESSTGETWDYEVRYDLNPDVCIAHQYMLSPINRIEELPKEAHKVIQWDDWGGDTGEAMRRIRENVLKENEHALSQ